MGSLSSKEVPLSPCDLNVRVVCSGSCRFRSGQTDGGGVK